MNIKEVKTSKKVGEFELKSKKQEEWGNNYIIKFNPKFYEDVNNDSYITKKEYEDDIPRV